MTNRSELADLLFPQVTIQPEQIIGQDPPRSLPPGAKVTRFASSPTGFLILYICAKYV